MFVVNHMPARTLSWWYHQRASIDMSPKYQRRGGIWSAADKAFLIDSIINEFDIPKLYLADFTYGSNALNEHNTQYAVIDGKQRFEAIFDFFDSRVPLRHDFEFLDNPEFSLGGLSYKDLKAGYPDVASKFENFNLSVMAVMTDDESKINELFVRLNRSKPLTGAEIRNAMSGVVPGLIRDIAANDFFASKIRFGVTRAQDQNTAAKLLLMEFRGKIVDTKKISLDRLVDEGIQAEADIPNFRRSAKRVERNLRAMNRVFIDRDPLLASQGQVPVYYWLVRSSADEYLDQVREFLVQFENDRAANRQLARDPSVDPSTLDSELLLYDTLNRSVNDQGSLEGRYEILHRRFDDF